MAIKDILLPLVGEPSAAAIAAIDKCMAVAGDMGARVTAMAVEEDILVRPKVTISDDLDNMAAAEATRMGFGLRVGNMGGTSLAMAPAFLIGQSCRYADLDGALLLAKDREHPMLFEDGALLPPSPLLWG